jgi:hypothetical protein
MDSSRDLSETQIDEALDIRHAANAIPLLFDDDQSICSLLLCTS